MDENGGLQIECTDLSPIPSLDAQLTELIEFVWACEAAGRQEERIDAVIRYGSN